MGCDATGALIHAGTYVDVFGNRAAVLYHSGLMLTAIPEIPDDFYFGVTSAGDADARVARNLQTPGFPPDP